MNAQEVWNEYQKSGLTLGKFAKSKGLDKSNLHRTFRKHNLINTEDVAGGDHIEESKVDASVPDPDTDTMNDDNEIVVNSDLPADLPAVAAVSSLEPETPDPEPDCTSCERIMELEKKVGDLEASSKDCTSCEKVIETETALSVERSQIDELKKTVARLEYEAEKCDSCPDVAGLEKDVERLKNKIIDLQCADVPDCTSCEKVGALSLSLEAAQVKVGELGAESENRVSELGGELESVRSRIVELENELNESRSKIKDCTSCAVRTDLSEAQAHVDSMKSKLNEARQEISSQAEKSGELKKRVGVLEEEVADREKKVRAASLQASTMFTKAEQFKNIGLRLGLVIAVLLGMVLGGGMFIASFCC